jgi:hypothetical protein
VRLETERLRRAEKRLTVPEEWPAREIDPGPVLGDLHTRVLRQDVTLLPPALNRRRGRGRSGMPVLRTWTAQNRLPR